LLLGVHLAKVCRPPGGVPGGTSGVGRRAGRALTLALSQGERGSGWGGGGGGGGGGRGGAGAAARGAGAGGADRGFLAWLGTAKCSLGEAAEETRFPRAARNGRRGRVGEGRADVLARAASGRQRARPVARGGPAGQAAGRGGSGVSAGARPLARAGPGADRATARSPPRVAVLGHDQQPPAERPRRGWRRSRRDDRGRRGRVAGDVEGREVRRREAD